MKNRVSHMRIWLVLLVLAMLACRSEFEKARISGDPEFVLKKAYELYDKEEYMKAQQLFELVLNQYRGTAEAEQMYFKYAYTYYNLRSYSLAAHYFENFASTFAYSPFREEAAYMSAYSNYMLSPIFRLDQESTEQAIDGFQEFVNTYPDSDRAAECNRLIMEMREKLERKAYESAKLYFDLKQYEAAMHSLENLLSSYPESEKAEEVQFMLIDAAYNYAQRSVFERREERYKETMDFYREFIKKFPRSDMRDAADKLYAASRNELENLMQ